MSTRKSPITCHVLDASSGKPADGVEVRVVQAPHELSSPQHFSFDPIAHGVTDANGRCADLMAPKPGEPEIALSAGLYKVIFKTKEYFHDSGRPCFYPWVEITFEIEDPSQHYHIPLLISPYSFTTYRGS
ncbi:Hydroxyisourate hydrolase [Rickenella mellea]|uniref:5-hydroxyisourate hydrolase n=1 Tax=Rickenella mellea TaxID=50990 RepID=A0A4Y7QLX3_9AGAM|nr:Hydroxyisourate hydrolase [Rickenella mellea]